MIISDADLDRCLGKRVILYLKDSGVSVEGKCVGLTPACDNDPEVDTPEVRGKCSYSINTPDIDRIETKE